MRTALSFAVLIGCSALTVATVRAAHPLDFVPADAAMVYALGVRTSVAFPLRIGERIIGTFNVASDSVNAFFALSSFSCNAPCLHAGNTGLSDQSSRLWYFCENTSRPMIRRITSLLPSNK